MKDGCIDESSFDFWAEREFGGAELGDVRRTRRLVKIASAKAKNTEAAMSLCCSKNDSQSVCRLFDREEATFNSVIDCHRERTVERCGEYDLIYAVQDTSFLDFTSHKALEGLGKICHSKNSSGLVMHTGMAVAPDKTPLGLLDVKIWARPDGPTEDSEEEKKSKKNSRKFLPIEEKESFKWLRCKENAVKLLGNSSCNVILVSDRESDIFELFASPRPKNFDLLIRANFNRCAESQETDDDAKKNKTKLFNLMEKSMPKGEYELTIPRRKGKKERKTTIVVMKDWKVKTVNTFVRGVGILGGLPARKSAGNPGTKTLWLGLRRLNDLLQGFLLATQTQQSSVT